MSNSDSGLPITAGLAGLLLLLVSGALILLLSRREGVSAQAITALVLQLVLAALFFANFGLVADDKTYHNLALIQAERWRSDTVLTPAFTASKTSITYVLGALYFFFGPYEGLGLILNAALLGFAPILTAISCKNFGLPQIKTTAAWLACLAPPFLIWSPWLRREGMTFTLMFLIVLAMSLIHRSRYFAGILMFVGTFLGLYFTRRQLLLVLISSALVSFLMVLYRRRNSWNRRPTVAGGWVLLAAGIIASAFVILRSSYFRQFMNEGLVRSILASNSDRSQNLGIEGVSWEHNTSAIGFFFNLGRSLWGPYPWDWKSEAWVIAGLDGLLFLIVAILICRALRRNPSVRRIGVTLLVPLVPLLLGSTLLLANYGLAMRVRAHYLPFLIPIVAMALVGDSRNRQRSSIGPLEGAEDGLMGRIRRLKTDFSLVSSASGGTATHK